MSKINRTIKKEQEPAPKKTTRSDLLSKESMQILYNIMGVYGKGSIDDTVKQIGEDFRAIFPTKYEFDYDHSRTISEVFAQIYKERNESSKSFENIISASNNDWIQRLLFEVWGIDPAVPAIYQIAKAFGFEGTIFDFVCRAAVENIKKVGWNVKHYYNEEYGKKMPIIIDPSGRKLRFPLK